MPQNTPMIRQFTTIDGRTVMSNLPQHWGGNDWKITGVDNPLPVGNYVQTEAGVWLSQKGSDDGAADVRLAGSNLEKHRVLLQRSVRTNGLYTAHLTDEVPHYARGVIVSLRVEGVTGTFQTGEGYSLRVINGFTNDQATVQINRRISDHRTPTKTTSVKSHSIIITPDTIDTTALYSGENDIEFIHAQTPLGRSLSVILNITGTFGDGEGIDCDVHLNWLI